MLNIVSSIKNTFYLIRNIHQDILTDKLQKKESSLYCIRYSFDLYHTLHSYLNNRYIFHQLIANHHNMTSILYLNHYDKFCM